MARKLSDDPRGQTNFLTPCNTLPPAADHLTPSAKHSPSPEWQNPFYDTLSMIHSQTASFTSLMCTTVCAWCRIYFPTKHQRRLRSIYPNSDLFDFFLSRRQDSDQGRLKPLRWNFYLCLIFRLTPTHTNSSGLKRTQADSGRLIGFSRSHLMMVSNFDSVNPRR